MKQLWEENGLGPPCLRIYSKVVSPPQSQQHESCSMMYTKNTHPGHVADENTLWQTYKKLWKITIEIVSCPMKNGDFPIFSIVFSMFTRPGTIQNHDISMVFPQDALAGAIMEGCSVELRETRALAISVDFHG